MTTPDPLARARRLARLLDSAASVPGTRIRFGLDPVLGLVPGLGDAAGAMMSVYLVLVGSRLGVPRTTIVRMLANVAVDFVGGTLPILGDAFDVAFKSNTRNLALLERALGTESAAGAMGAGSPAEPRASRTLVVGSVIVLTVLAIAGIVAAAFVIRYIAAHVDVGRGG